MKRMSTSCARCWVQAEQAPEVLQFKEGQSLIDPLYLHPINLRLRIFLLQTTQLSLPVMRPLVPGFWRTTMDFIVLAGADHEISPLHW